MTNIEKTESNWNESRAIAQKVRQEYLDAYDRWEILNREQERLFQVYLEALRAYKYSPYRSLEDGEIIADIDQWRFSEQHEWDYFKASVGQPFSLSEWVEGTQTRTCRSTTK